MKNEQVQSATRAIAVKLAFLVVTKLIRKYAENGRLEDSFGTKLDALLVDVMAFLSIVEAKSASDDYEDADAIAVSFVPPGHVKCLRDFIDHLEEEARQVAKRIRCRFNFS